jgi:hypothetical protein
MLPSRLLRVRKNERSPIFVVKALLLNYFPIPLIIKSIIK